MEKHYAIIVLGADNIPRVNFIGKEEEAKSKYLMKLHQYDEIKKLIMMKVMLMNVMIKIIMKKIKFI